MKLLRDSRYAIFASGFGSNAHSLIKMGQELNHPPSLVIATNRESRLKVICEELGLAFIETKALKKGIDLEFEANILSLLKTHSISCIFLAGFLKILSPHFLAEFSGNSIINIHPSLLPLYPGLGGYKKAYQNGDRTYGHTIHLVTEEVDSGPVLSQVVLEADLSLSLDEFIEVGKKAENRNYARVLKELIQGDFVSDIK